MHQSQSVTQGLEQWSCRWITLGQCLLAPYHIIRIGMVNVMEKWCFHAQTRRQMLTLGECLNPHP